MGWGSMAELVAAVSGPYQGSNRADRRQILDEFVAAHHGSVKICASSAKPNFPDTVWDFPETGSFPDCPDSVWEISDPGVCEEEPTHVLEAVFSKPTSEKRGQVTAAIYVENKLCRTIISPSL